MNDIDLQNTPDEIKAYYDKFFVSDVPAKYRKLLQKQLIYQLYQTPKKDSKSESPTTLNNIDQTPNKIHQLDLLFMPDDNGYKYGLTIVDCGSRETQCLPLKTKNSKKVLEALLKLYNDKSKTNHFKIPNHLEVDSGTEFKGEFAKYFLERGVTIRVSKPFRSRQNAIVESRNGIISRALFKNMTLVELNTNEISREWVKYLPDLLKSINKRYFRKPIKLTDKELFPPLNPMKGNTPLLSPNTKVRVQLDKPINVFGEKQHGSFRAGDIRWTLKVYTIDRIQMNNKVVLYKIKGLTPLYTRNQLQVVDDTILNTRPNYFVVEKIVDKRKFKNRIEYLVKWKNYPDSDNTWESRRQLLLDGIKPLIDEYEENH